MPLLKLKFSKRTTFHRTITFQVNRFVSFGTIFYFNIEKQGSHFSGLTKFPDFSSIFCHFSSIFLMFYFLTENLIHFSK